MKIVDMDKAKHLKNVCKNCQNKMWEFHIFQEFVRQCQICLHRTEVEVVVKNEVVVDGDDVNLGNDDKIEDTRPMPPLTYLTPIHPLIYRGDNQMTFQITELEANSEDEVKPNIALPELEIDDVHADAESMPEKDDDNEDEAEFISNKEEEKGGGDNVAEDDEENDSDGYEVLMDSNWDDPNKVDELQAIWLPNIQCVYCPLAYPNFKLLRKHMHLKHPNNEFCISCCNRTLYSRRQISDHLLVHSDPKIFDCKRCNKSYTSIDGLRGHIYSMHANRMKFKCNLCSKRFLHQKGLELHRKRYHGNPTAMPPEIKTTADGRTVFGCRQCANVYITEKSFKRHRYNKHSRDGKHGCEICGKFFKSILGYKNHMSLHSEKRTEPTTCIACGCLFVKTTPHSERRKKSDPFYHPEKCKNCICAEVMLNARRRLAEDVLRSDT
ncbi:zinc finger E-box-binding homeobox 1 [Stomoxys calcitrans]|uniref:zinc finger E-box-binding homeobox 1 n=1 Tax=Stomoxys calcitrans TaxID=35570 RepID=UPI0027E27FC3|nr:zinc finger E-box-binding homeobox 1 [Stomoxys calcitrans]